MRCFVCFYFYHLPGRNQRIKWHLGYLNANTAFTAIGLLWNKECRNDVECWPRMIRGTSLCVYKYLYSCCDSTKVRTHNPSHTRRRRYHYTKGYDPDMWEYQLLHSLPSYWEQACSPELENLAFSLTDITGCSLTVVQVSKAHSLLHTVSYHPTTAGMNTSHFWYQCCDSTKAWTHDLSHMRWRRHHYTKGSDPDMREHHPLHSVRKVP